MQLKHQAEVDDSELSEQESEFESDGTESDGSRPRDIFDDEESDDKSDTESAEDTDDEEIEQPETDTMISSVYEEFEDYKDAMIETLMREGRDEEHAKEEAHRYLLPKYRKAFRQKLSDTLVRLNQIRQEPIYKVVMDTAKELRSDGLDHKESIRAAIGKRKHKINEYIPDELDEEDADDEDEEQDYKRARI